MNKSDIIEHVAEIDGVASKAQAKRIVDSIIDKIVTGIVSDTGVAISGLGTFHTVQREAREGRNPQTNEAIQIPAKKVPKFRASQKLRDAVAA